MNSKKTPLIYLFSLLSFIGMTFFYSPRPKLNEFLPNLEKNYQNNIKEVYLNKVNLNNKIKRRINIGKSYVMVVDDEISINLTYLTFWDKKNLNLSYYAKYLPEIIIDTDELTIVNENNYGKKDTFLGRKYQACVFNLRNPSFFYKNNIDEIVHRYNNYEYWRWVIKKGTLAVFGNFQENNFDCLLLTTTSPKIFEDEAKKILQIVTKNFVFQ